MLTAPRAVSLAACIAISAGSTPARAQSGSESAPTAFADPAMSGVSPLVPHLGGMYMPRFPSIGVSGPATGGAVATPGGPEGFLSFGISEYIGGGLGVHPTLSLGADFGMELAGATQGSITAGSQTYDGSSSLWWGIRLPSPGVAWHRTGWILGAQLVPELAWMYAQYKDAAGDRATGNALLFMASVDVQGCREYNLGGTMPRNSAVCLYAAPIVYAGDFFNGASFGVRSYLF